jgi:hypothetical protein
MRLLWLAFLGAAFLSGCTAILGDFTLQETSDSDGGGTTPVLDSGPGDAEGNVDSSTLDDDSSTPEDGGGYASAPPADSGPPDVLQLPDVGPPGNPGVAITAAGGYCTSSNFHFFGAVGESPGGNVTASSANVKLISGVIGATGN